MRIYRHLGIATTFATLLSASSALAISVPSDVPSAADPARVQQRFTIQERPDVSADSIISSPEESGQGVVKSDVTFALTSIRFENLTVFTEAELREVYAPYLGKEISLRTLNEIAAKITAKYRNAGYILSRAVVPPQRIDSGTVTIRIIEGSVDSVRFQGVALENDLLARYADKIRASKPLDSKVLERYLLLMEDLPGISARAVIQPSAATPGTSDVIITLSEKTVDGELTLDNRGSRYMGMVQSTATLNVNNMLGLFERTQLRGAITPGQSKELRYGQILHEQQIGSEGTKIELTASRTVSEPGRELRDLDLHGENDFYGVRLSHPFIRSRQSNLYGQATFDVRNVDVDLLGARFYEDRLRVGRLGGVYDFVDSWAAVNRFDATLSKGFGWDDDTALATRSRANGETSFTKINATANRLQPIDGPFSLYLSAAGQWSNDPLLSAERFGIGGPAFLSGYDPSELTGDSGAAGRVELQYSQKGEIELLKAYQLYGFTDYGKVWQKQALAGEEKQDSLTSAGIGARVSFAHNIGATLEMAVPLSKDVAAEGDNGDEPRFFFGLNYLY